MYDVAVNSYVFEDPLSGNPWHLVWLRGGPRLSANDKKHFGRLIVMMNYKDQEQEDFKGDSCEGRVWTKGKVAVIGQFYGIEYLAHLDTEDGPVDVSVIFCGNKQKQKAALN